jgi:hypothetical protein
MVDNIKRLNHRGRRGNTVYTEKEIKNPISVPLCGPSVSSVVKFFERKIMNENHRGRRGNTEYTEKEIKNPNSVPLCEPSVSSVVNSFKRNVQNA